MVQPVKGREEIEVGDVVARVQLDGHLEVFYCLLVAVELREQEGPVGVEIGVAGVF